ncbi:MAG: NADPH-dependent F420 reductase [Deltaproteobacteria bacterium]|nr:NADPH-dependent F420 reductase [Deltaproteobacteria bacterium]
MNRIAFVGGTGPEGMGLALRCALAGEAIVIGSREATRAESTAEKLRMQLRGAGSSVDVLGRANGDAVDGVNIVALCMPFAGLEPVLRELAPKLSGKILLDLVNPLVMQKGSFVLQAVAAGSAGELAQQLVPDAYVVSAFKNLSAEELCELTHTLVGDVVLCGNHDESKRRIVELIGRIPTLRAVDAGGLVNARHLESITALLLNLNRRHKAITSIEILGLK